MVNIEHLSEIFNKLEDFDKGMGCLQLFNFLLEKVIQRIYINHGETIYKRLLQLLAYANNIQ